MDHELENSKRAIWEDNRREEKFQIIRKLF